MIRILCEVCGRVDDYQHARLAEARGRIETEGDTCRGCKEIEAVAHASAKTVGQAAAEAEFQRFIGAEREKRKAPPEPPMPVIEPMPAEPAAG